jgi:uncharacterized RDD family membrane protein YckC
MNENVEYAGFWVRVGATFIDTILLMIITIPLVTMFYGQDYFTGNTNSFGLLDLLINYLLPAVAVLLFWTYKSATPGKMFFNLKIVDARTGDKPTTGQLVGRYFGYYVSIIPFMLGIIWVAFDKRKQGFHDKLAGTVVIRGV